MVVKHGDSIVIFHGDSYSVETMNQVSIDWFKGNIRGKPYVSWENLAGFQLRFSLKSTH